MGIILARGAATKPDTHPVHGPVVLRDRGAGVSLLSRSTTAGRGGGPTVGWEDGHTCPLVDVDVSAASHPSRTGTARVLDTEGRVETSRRRYGRSGGSCARPGRARAVAVPASYDPVDPVLREAALADLPCDVHDLVVVRHSPRTPARGRPAPSTAVAVSWTSGASGPSDRGGAAAGTRLPVTGYGEGGAEASPAR